MKTSIHPQPQEIPQVFTISASFVNIKIILLCRMAAVESLLMQNGDEIIIERRTFVAVFLTTRQSKAEDTEKESGDS